MSVPRITSVLLCMFLITTVPVSPVATAQSGSSISERASLSLGTPASEAVTQTAATESANSSNISSRHIGPELTQEEPSAEIVISEVEARVGSRLLNSTDAIRAGQFDTAETTISGNTTELLRQYERLAAETESTADDEVAQEFNLTVQQQRRLVSLARNSTTIYNEYQVARANGNQTRARQLARELLEQTATGNQTADSLAEQYQVLQNETDLNATESIAGIRQAQARLAEIQDTVRSETLTPTSLRVTSSAVASPVQPVDVSGSLVANTSRLVEKNITIGLNDRIVQTKTNEAGEFNASLRPVMIAPGEQTLFVQFTPDPTSIYDEDRVEKRIQIESVSPTAEIQYSPSRVQFNEMLVIEGKITANEIPLSGVPVTTTVADQSFSSTSTDTQGNFRIQGSLPATISNGSQEIDVRISNENTAVQQVTQTNEIYINSTETKLSFISTQNNDSNISFVGQLATTDGTGLSNRSISITQENSSRVILDTNQSGYFEGSIPQKSTTSVFQLPFFSDQRTLTAQYDPVGGNLEPATQNTGVSYTPPVSVLLQQIGIVGIAIAIIYGVSVWRRREAQSKESKNNLPQIEDSKTTLSPKTIEDESPDELLSNAKKHHTEGEMEAAARLSYAALRKKYIEAYDLTQSLTHWELYQTVKPDLNSSSQELLYEVTGLYEEELYSNQDFDSTEDLDTILEKLADVIKSDNES